jgi:hypothetical protein
MTFAEQPDQALAAFLADQRSRLAAVDSAVSEMEALLRERQGLERVLGSAKALAEAMPTSETFAARAASLEAGVAAINERLDSLREVVNG